MKPNLSHYEIHPVVQKALRIGKPVVALESTVITHGLPHPENAKLALEMEAVVESEGCVPATIAVLDGKIRIGLDQAEIESLAADKDAKKLSVRDLPAAVYHGWSGGTTVAATMFAARASNILVFATGGIGGVHRGNPADISADLPQLARTPMIVVCAGAKAVLDIPATLEYLETYGVPVVGYQTDNFPAFYAGDSGFPVHHRLDEPEQIVEYAQNHWEIGLRSALLIAQPPPVETALEHGVMEAAVEKALALAEENKVRGQEVTPFLLAAMAELTDSASLETNLALLKNNAILAASIAKRLAARTQKRIGFV